VADYLVRIGGGGWGQGVCVVAMAAVLAVYFPYYSHAQFIAGDTRKQAITQMSAEKVDAFDRAKLLIPIGYDATRWQIRSIYEIATSKDDFLPQTVPQKPTEPAAEALITPGTHGPVTQNRLNDYRTEVEMPADGAVRLQQFWFPGWQAAVDGVPVNTTAAGPQAVVSCPVPAGHHTVEFRYDAYSQRRIGVVITLVTLGLSIFAILLGGKNTEEISLRTAPGQTSVRSTPTSGANLDN
jgi:hypothetical protein